MDELLMRTRLGSSRVLTVLSVLVLGAACLPHPARAALGESESAIPDEASRAQASLKSTARNNYRVHELTLPSGTVLRQFAAPGGKVFAVSWRGPAVPNLRQALGRHFDAYVAAAGATHVSRTHFEMRQSDLVVQVSGHMRAYSGRAYVPADVPGGVAMEELR